MGVYHSFCPRGRAGLTTCITGQMTRGGVCIQRGWSAWGSGLHSGAVADPGFPRGGAPTPWGRQHTILPKFPKNCMKLKEFVSCDPTHLVPPLRWGWTEPPPPPETRSTSRWYASYWNAFMFLQYFSRFIFSYFMNEGNSSKNFSTLLYTWMFSASHCTLVSQISFGDFALHLDEFFAFGKILRIRTCLDIC